MKRFVSLALLLVLLTSLPAQAATWFDDGEKLHRDPFCMEAAFSFASFYTPSLEFASEEDARAHGSICECCTALVTPVEGADDPVVWYYNPDGGKFFHSENCAFVKNTTPCYDIPTLLSRVFLPCEDFAAAELAIEYTGGN